MTNITRYTHPIASKHFCKKPLDAYIYDNIFDDRYYTILKNAIVKQIEQPAISYGIHRTSFTFEGSNKKIVSHKQNARDQQVVYDLTFEEQWWHQTSATVFDWAIEHLKANINPIFYKFLHHFQTLSPFADEPNCWIPFRWHINVLHYSEFLMLHADMNDQYFNTPGAETARAKSLTFYLQDHVEGWGGEFWTDTGFIYKPKQNTAIAINGNEALHGINANMRPDKKPRLAFTTRWAHKDDFYLPGHPDKALYKLEW